MNDERTDVTSGRVLGPIAVVFVFLVLIVVSRVTSTDETSVGTTFAFVNTTSTTVATTTTQAPTTSTTQPANTPIATASTVSYAAGWTGLPANNLEERIGFVAVEAGDRVVVWGGIGPTGTGERSDGAFYSAGAWTPMSDSPIVADSDPVAVWTGSEVFVYSGAAGAWNPSKNRWRTLADPSTGNTGGGGPIAGAWTGDQVILVGYRLHPPNFEDNLFVTSYGTDLGCCRSYPDPPFSLTYGEAFWTGDEMLLIGALLDSNGTPKTEDGLGRMAGLDPVSGTWTEYDPPPFSAGGRITAAWTGWNLIAWNAWRETAEWTKDAGWRSLAGPPLAGGTCRPRTAAVGDDVFAMLCGQAAVWSNAAQRWYSIRGPDTVNWSSDLCIPMALTPAGNVVDVWCSLDEGNAFWRIDLSKVEATRYSGLATLSQWELLPNPAATRLESTSMVWSGDELLYFSGQGTEVEEFRGWGYDPETNVMHGIPDAPWPGRWGQVALWTGDEMLIQRGPTTLWNPISLEWRTAEQSPALGGFPFAVWTGEEAIFYGSRIEQSNSGAAYNPDTDTWRPIATGPVAVAVGVQVMAWSGEEMYVLGNVGGFPGSQSGTVYDPKTDRWRPLPPIPEEFALWGSVGDFVDGEFIVLGENWDPHLTDDAPPIAGLAYSPASNTWRTIATLQPGGTLPRPDVNVMRFPASMAAIKHGDELAVFLPAEYSRGPATIAFYRPSTDTWRYVDGAPASAWGPRMVSGDTFVAYLTGAGTVLLHDN